MRNLTAKMFAVDFTIPKKFKFVGDWAHNLANVFRRSTELYMNIVVNIEWSKKINFFSIYMS